MHEIREQEAPVRLLFFRIYMGLILVRNSSGRVFSLPCPTSEDAARLQRRRSIAYNKRRIQPALPELNSMIQICGGRKKGLSSL